MKKGDIVTRRYDSQYKEGVVRLQNRFSPARDFAQERAEFEWFYEQNPYMKKVGLNPLFIATNDHDMVVGARGYSLLKYQIRGAEFYSLGASKAIVHPDYRRQGIFERLNLYSLNYLQQYPEIKTFLNLSSNRFSTPGYLKLGWIPLAPKTYMHCFNLVPKARNNNIQASLTIKRALLTIESPNDKLADLYASSVSATDRFSLKRDRTYYSWRFNCPGARFLFGRLTVGGQLLAYAVIQDLGTSFRIVEYQYTDLQQLKTLIKGLKKALPCRWLSIWALSRQKQELAAFRQLGFLHVNQLLAKFLGRPKQYALVRPNVLNPGEADWRICGKDIRQISNWDLYYADVDSV